MCERCIQTPNVRSFKPIQGYFIGKRTSLIRNEKKFFLRAREILLNRSPNFLGETFSPLKYYGLNRVISVPFRDFEFLASTWSFSLSRAVDFSKTSIWFWFSLTVLHQRRLLHFWKWNARACVNFGGPEIELGDPLEKYYFILVLHQPWNLPFGHFSNSWEWEFSCVRKFRRAQNDLDDPPAKNHNCYVSNCNVSRRLTPGLNWKSLILFNYPHVLPVK